MSRSRRKTPIRGTTCARSDKPFKRIEHRRERAAVRARMTAQCDVTELPAAKTFGDPWRGAKDGKQWLPGYLDDARWLRK